VGLYQLYLQVLLLYVQNRYKYNKTICLRYILYPLLSIYITIVVVYTFFSLIKYSFLNLYFNPKCSYHQSIDSCFLVMNDCNSSRPLFIVIIQRYCSVSPIMYNICYCECVRGSLDSLKHSFNPHKVDRRSSLLSLLSIGYR